MAIVYFMYLVGWCQRREKGSNNKQEGGINRSKDPMQDRNRGLRMASVYQTSVDDAGMGSVL